MNDINKNIYQRTPVTEALALGKKINKNIFLKMEAYQPTGSFKIRGMENLCRYHLSNSQRDRELLLKTFNRKKHLVSSSGGNAGYNVAYVGRKLGAGVTVVVPENSKESAREKIRQEGAELIVFGESWDDAHQKALELTDSLGASYIHPFEHPKIWEGHSSMIDEMKEQMPEPDAIILSVGGGGLLCGVLEGMHKNNWQDIPLISVETEGAASFYNSVKAGKVITLEKVSSIANTLGAKRICDKAFEWTKKHQILATLVSDSEAISACRDFAEEHRTIVEPACGAALALLYQNKKEIQPFKNIAVIVCGGAGVSLKTLEL